MSLQICTLASSSKGNCTYITDGKTRILVDIGISLSNAKRLLANMGIAIEELDGVLITHEHTDHIKGLAMLNSKTNVSIFAHNKAQKAIDIRTKTNIKYADVYNYDGGFYIKDLYITPFRIPHDASYPLGYVVQDAKHKIAVATDIGEITRGIESNILDCDMAVIESNHDISMVNEGNYPEFLKSRILGKSGHLSNNAAAELITKMASNRLKKVILGHLSESNNMPHLAYDTLSNRLSQEGLLIARDIEIEVASAICCSKIMEV